MNKPDFNANAYYTFKIFSSDSKELYSGVMNDKAWSKTIENGVVWEYIKDNSRVIEKLFDGLIPDLAGIKIVDGEIAIRLCEKESIKSEIDHDSLKYVLSRLEDVIKTRKMQMPENSYTTHLFTKGEDKILKKLGEEAVEVILAKNSIDETIYETADLLYHIMVYFVYKGIPFDEVLKELNQRMNK